MEISNNIGWLSTLLYSFGSEAPEEVYWGVNEMITWLNDYHGFQLEHLYHPYTLEAEDPDYNESERVEAIQVAIKTLVRT